MAVIKYEGKEIKSWTPVGDVAGRMKDIMIGTGRHKNTHRILYISTEPKYMNMLWLEWKRRKHLEHSVVTGHHVWWRFDLKTFLLDST